MSLSTGLSCLLWADQNNGVSVSAVPGTASQRSDMAARRKLTVKGRGPDGRVTFYLEAYRGTVWITSYDCPFTCEAILETTHADSLVELITQTIKEARGHRNDSS